MAKSSKCDVIYRMCPRRRMSISTWCGTCGCRPWDLPCSLGIREIANLLLTSSKSGLRSSRRGCWKISSTNWSIIFIYLLLLTHLLLRMVLSLIFSVDSCLCSVVSGNFHLYDFYCFYRFYLNCKNRSIIGTRWLTPSPRATGECRSTASKQTSHWKPSDSGNNSKRCR